MGDVDVQLADLQRKYRIMEGNRKAYSEDSQKLIVTQRGQIEKLKTENKALKDELAMETKGALAPPTTFEQEEMARLQDAADFFTRKIESEKRRVEEIQGTLELCESKLVDTRRQMGGVNASRDSNTQVAKQVKVLENRLDKALVKFNEALSHNKVLREEIDNLRRERVVFDQIYKKLERELHEKKKEMANVIEISNIAYEARDQAQNEIAALRAQADKEQAAFEAEWRELGKLIDADKKMAEFLKNRKDYTLGDMSIEDETKLRKKVIKGNWGIAKDKANANVALDAVQNYQDAFAKIQAATGITDIDELVTTFINAEDQNFSLFNYVNELNQEMEKLEEQIQEINLEAERYKGQAGSTDSQRKQIVKDLEERVAKAEARSGYFDQRYGQSMRTMTGLKTGITSIFNKIGCNTAEVRELLGDEGVTENNMEKYLGIIEQRSNEVLQVLAAKGALGDGIPSGGEAGAVSDPRILLGGGPQTPAGTNLIAVDPPSTADEYQSDDDSEEEVEDRPLSREELQAKTLRSLNKRTVDGKYKGAQRSRKR